jgi:DNA replication licensing factor MCM6
MKSEELTTLTVDFAHVREFNDKLAEIITENYYRFENELRAALLQFVKNLDLAYAVDERSHNDRQFYLSFVNVGVKTMLREIKPSAIGQLFSFQGTVTRTSDVCPELLRGTFKCKVCGTEIPNVSQNFQYTEPSVCPSKACNNHSKFELLTEKSLFVDWQRVLVQETTTETPESAMPRTMEVILRHDLVDAAKPGDICIFTGTPVAIPETAKRSIGERPVLQRPAGFETDGVTGVKGYGVRELTYRLSFLCSSVSSVQNTTVEESTSREKAINMKQSTTDLYTKLAHSIAPNVYGHEDVKRGILLMLLGGVHKETPDHISIRGDINVCIVGDPSTAKSQFLKYVSHAFPRSIYTSGQSSSAAGLTATVAKDPESGDFTIEAGALMLADNGVCCIDEFDKMSPVDQVAIHEAMEQQTISIAKAGIHATLNARASILAAANPIGGRYNSAKSLRANLNLPSPIMSRFDLFFVVVDEAKQEMDRKIAQHIIRVHRQLPDEQPIDIFTKEDLVSYIQFAKKKEPKLTDEAVSELVKSYTTLRSEDASVGNSSYRITVRQLEALVRLSEALAKLHLSDTVNPQFVKEATRLLKHSIVQMVSEPIQFNNIDYDISDEENDTEQQKEKSNEPRKITYEKYKQIANNVIHHLQQLADAGTPGLTIEQLVDWYQEENSALLSGENFEESMALIRLTIRRLIQLDHVLEENDSTHAITVSPDYLSYE